MYTWSTKPWMLCGLHYLQSLRINTPCALERDREAAPLQCGPQMTSNRRFKYQCFGSSENTCPAASFSTERTRTHGPAWWIPVIQPITALWSSLSIWGTRAAGMYTTIQGWLGHLFMPCLCLATVSQTMLDAGNIMKNQNSVASALTCCR